MKLRAFLLFLVFVLVLTGCGKKCPDGASLTVIYDYRGLYDYTIEVRVFRLLGEGGRSQVANEFLDRQERTLICLTVGETYEVQTGNPGREKWETTELVVSQPGRYVVRHREQAYGFAELVVETPTPTEPTSTPTTPTPATPTPATPEQEPPPAVTVGKSVYDGTYSGMFTYEYRDQRWDPKEDRWVDTTGWITATLRLTVTFKFRETRDGMTALDITHVICSDQSFGTGLGGITPLPFPESYAMLPADPPTTPMEPSVGGMGVVVEFPNGSYIMTSVLPGALDVGFNGQRLSHSLDPSFQDETWLTYGTDTFSSLQDSGVRREIKFKSWSLTKSYG